jgi:predicted lipoprotein
MNIHYAILNLAPNAEFYVEDTYSSIVWKSENIPKPTEAEVNAEISRLQAEYDAKQYQRDRAKDYPSIQEQMDMQYWDAINGTTTWLDAINSIKQKYPKGVLNGS